MPPTIVNVNGVMVDFPFEPYPCQVEYMKKVVQCLQQGYNGILESPTGTGKTLCLLCASLGWLQDKKAQIANWQLSAQAPNINQKDRDTLVNALNSAAGQWSGEYTPPKIIYASRTHSQLGQAVREMKRTSYSHFKACVLGSREQLCIHPYVMKEESNVVKVHLCRAKVSARTCHFYNNIESTKPSFDNTVLDIEDLVTLGQKNKCCPYYMARELKSDASIIFLPYNYLLDPKTRKAHGVELAGNIVIFDEAHNLERICEENASFDLSSADLASAVRDCQEVIGKIEKMLGYADSELPEGFLNTQEQGTAQDFTLQDVLTVKGLLLGLEQEIDKIQLKSDVTTLPGSHIFQILGKIGITFETKRGQIELLEKLIAFLSNEGGSGFHSKGSGLSKFQDVLKVAFSRDPLNEFTPLGNHQHIVSRHYKVCVQEETKKGPGKKSGWDSGPVSSKTGRTLSYWCFSPSYAMEELKDQGVKCFILTSGTLSPIDSFTKEMGLDFKVHLENPHVIEKHQVMVGVVPKGPNGTILSSTYENRSKVEYMSALGNAVVNFSRVVPHGLLLFFPSYPVMAQTLQHWQEKSIWSTIEQQKIIFTEPRNKVDFNLAIEGYYSKINDSNGAVFAAVTRGKVSEGLDFSDANGRAVVITGLPYPPMMDPKVKLKMQFLDETMSGGKGLSGREWYKQQASRAVNQAIGRVIRHKQDYGAILLCDVRFGAADAIKQLPCWVRPYCKVFDNFGTIQKELISFFKTAAQLLPPPVLFKKDKPSSGGASQTAFFEPVASRSRTRVDMGTVEKANTVVCHGPQGVQPDLYKLSYEYSGASSTAVATTPIPGKGLLAALDSAKPALHINLKQVMPPTKLESFTQKVSFPSSTDGQRKRIVLKKATDLNPANEYLKKVKKVLNSESYNVFKDGLQKYKKDSDYETLIDCLSTVFMDTETHHLFREFGQFICKSHNERFQETCIELLGSGSTSCHVTIPQPIKRSSQDSSSEGREGPMKRSRTEAACESPQPGEDVQSDNTTSQSDDTSLLYRTCLESQPPDRRSSQLDGGIAAIQACALTEKFLINSKVWGYTCCHCKGDAKRPLEAPCGHIACLDCWRANKDTKKCPQCGIRVKKKQLVQICYPKSSADAVCN